MLILDVFFCQLVLSGGSRCHGKARSCTAFFRDYRASEATPSIIGVCSFIRQFLVVILKAEDQVLNFYGAEAGLVFLPILLPPCKSWDHGHLPWCLLIPGDTFQMSKIRTMRWLRVKALATQPDNSSAQSHTTSGCTLTTTWVSQHTQINKWKQVRNM